MTDLASLSAECEPIVDAETWQRAWDDPETRWYARRTRRAFVGLVAAATFEALHPRGHDGKFIEKWGFVRWFDKSLVWRNGYVTDIDGETGAITVKGQGGNYFTFNNPKLLYARPKPKARMILPDPKAKTDAPGFHQVGGQGGSNPGAMYEVSNSKAALAGPSDAPEISAGNKLDLRLRSLTTEGASAGIHGPGEWMGWDDQQIGLGMLPNEIDTLQVPRLDGTKGRYDVVVKDPTTGAWYRVSATRPMMVDGELNGDLMVDSDLIFGLPGSERRQAVLSDPEVFGFKRDVNPAELAAAVRNAASSPPVIGDKFYVKTMNVEQRARSEALANDLYDLAGVPVPEVSIGTDPNTIASKIVTAGTFDPKNPAHVKAAQEGFVMDAWLANWDVIGKDFDNVKVDDQGTVWRIDAGGSLLYRAMGTPKGAMFGPTVTELESLRNAGLNPKAASVYGGIGNEDLKRQAEVLRSISPAQISELAATYDLPDVGSTLIARRKSILEQIPLDDPPLEGDLAPKPPTVFNPAEGVYQPGTPPQTAVKNWTWKNAQVPKHTVSSVDAASDEVMQNAIHWQMGDLWEYDSEYQNNGSIDGVVFIGRNMFTGQKRRLSVMPGDQILQSYEVGGYDTENLVDGLAVDRELAISEIVATQQGRTLPEIFADDAWRDTLPANFRPAESTLYAQDNLTKAIELGYIPEDYGVIHSKWNDTVYEIIDHDDTSVTLRESGSSDHVVLDSKGFAETGPWAYPANDTTEALYRARLQAGLGPTDESNVKAHLEQTKINEAVHTAPDGAGWPNTVDDNPAPNALKPATDDDKGHLMFAILDDKTIPEEDKNKAALEYAAYASAVNKGEVPPATPTVNKLASSLPYAPTKFSVPATQDFADTQVHASSPDAIQIDADSSLISALGPKTAMHTTEIGDEGDLEAYKALVGQNVAIMPEGFVVDPQHYDQYLRADWGLTKVSSVAKEATGRWVLTGTKGNGEPNRITLWSPSKWQMPVATVVVPVSADVFPQQFTYKQNGEIRQGPRLIGHWYKPGQNPADAHNWSYSATIEGGESLSGHPINASGYSKADMNRAVLGLTVPKKPVEKKKKTSAMHKTEADVAALTAKYTAAYTPEVKAQVTAEMTAKYAQPLPGETTLGDGTAPVKGGWVYSPKDGSWWTIQQVSTTATFKKGVAGEYVRVTRTVDGKKQVAWRNRNTLYSVEGDGKIPKAVSATNAVTMSDGHKTGPGQTILVNGKDSTVLETKSNTKLKVQDFQGVHWANASDAASAGYSDPNVVSTMSPDELQAQIDATVNATVADKVAAALAKDVAASPKKPPKVATVQYPGPNGSTYHQDPSYADLRTSKGLLNTKDGYAPQTGQVLRGDKGEQFVVVEMGDEWNLSHKNSAKVIPVGGGKQRWRAISKLVVDHQAMLSDEAGNPLPKVASVVGGSDAVSTLPNNTVLWRIGMQSYGKYNYKTHEYRMVTTYKYYGVQPDGNVYDMATGNAIPQYNVAYVLAPGNSSSTARVGVIDKDTGTKKLTLSIGKGQGGYSGWGPQVVGFNIGDPDDNATLTMVGGPKQPAPTPTPDVPSPPPVDLGKTGMLNGNQVQQGGIYSDPATGDTVLVKQLLVGDDGTFTQAYVHDFVSDEEYWLDNSGFEKFAAHPTTSASTATLYDGSIVAPGAKVSYGLSEALTVVSISPDQQTIVVDAPYGPLTLPTSSPDLSSAGAQPSTPGMAKKTLTLKDGTVATEGMEVAYGGHPVTILGIESADNTAQVQLKSGVKMTLPADGLDSGISPPTPTPAVTFGMSAEYQGQSGKITGISPGDWGTAGDKVFFKPEGAAGDWVSPSELKFATPAAPAMPAPSAPSAPTPPAAVTPAGTAGSLPPFTGIVGPELPHPTVTVSSKGGGTPALTPSGQVGDLATVDDHLPVAGTNSVMTAVQDAQATVAANKALPKGAQPKWVQKYAITDSDLIEDEMVETQIVRDAQGNDYIETRFRLDNAAAEATRKHMLVQGGGNQFGGWDKSKVDIFDLIVGDQISVKVSSQNQEQLKPNDVEMPNAVITSPPLLVGKGPNLAATTGKGEDLSALDLYRVDVAFSNGSTGVLELVSGHKNPFYRYSWDPQKQVKLTGNEQINPNAAAMGWSVTANSLGFDRADNQNVEHFDDGVKKLGGTGSRMKVANEGSAHAFQRIDDGATTTYQTSSTKNTIDGFVTIRVRADDPNAQKKISAAMETVGVPADRQGPPSVQDLGQMALGKVWRQFQPTYVRGQRTDADLAHPEQVLAMVDKEVGAYMPNKRKVTLNDISFRIAEDGHVQVLLSEDVSRAITKRNGVTFYQTRLSPDSWRTAAETSVNGGSPGLMSSVERFQNGMFYGGESSITDFKNEGAHGIYLSAAKNAVGPVDSSQSYSDSGNWVLFNPLTVHRQLDSYWANHDAWGKRELAAGADNRWLDMKVVKGQRNEMLMNRRMPPELWGQVRVSSESERDKIIARLHKQGITHAPNGVILEDFFVTGKVNVDKLPAPKWGDEINLGQIAGATQAGMPAVSAPTV